MSLLARQRSVERARLELTWPRGRKSRPTMLHDTQVNHGLVSSSDLGRMSSVVDLLTSRVLNSFPTTEIQPEYA